MLKLFVLLMGASPAQATTQTFAYDLIIHNPQLLATIELMGFDAKSAALAFDKAEKKSQEKGINTNYGTLAICADLHVRSVLIAGVEGAVCTTLFNLYSILAGGIAIGNLGNSAEVVAGFSLTADAIYFLTADGNPNNEHCFAGVEATVNNGKAIGGQAAVEVDCNTEKAVFKKGFFFAMRYGVGFGSDYRLSYLRINRVMSYY